MKLVGIVLKSAIRKDGTVSKMKYIRKNKRGFTLLEVVFVAAIMVIVIGAIASGWLFAHRVMTGEGKRTGLRMDMLKALETIRNDIRRSDVDYMSFYPETSGVYSALSMPLPEVEDGFYVRRGVEEEGDEYSDEIVWESFVIYHVVVSSGENILRRVLITPAAGIDPSDLVKETRDLQLQNVATGEDPDDPFTTQDLIKEGLQYFTIEPIGSIVDFYDDSSTAIEEENVIFGYAVLDSGEFTLRLTAKGEHELGSGYRMGLDSIKIDPSGGSREVEYGSIATVSGTSTTRISGATWGNHSYLRCDATGEDQYMEIADDYDLWRESSFDYAGLDNTMMDIDEVAGEVRVRLELPEDREGGERIAWLAGAQTGDQPQTGGGEENGRDGDLPEYPIVIRTIIKNESIDEDADLVRVFVRATRNNPLKIDAVYITRKEVLATASDKLTDPDGLVNVTPSGDIEDYHMHQQFFFRDVYDGDDDGDTDEILKEVWLPAGSEFPADVEDEDKGIWSEWVAFPMVKDADDEEETYDLDYLVTFYVPDLESVIFPDDEPWTDFVDSPTDLDTCLHWQGTGTNSFRIGGTISDELGVEIAGTPDWTYSLANDPDWAGQTVAASDNIYFISGIDIWKKTGTVESQIFDTAIDGPDYTGIKWEEESALPEGTTITVKVQTSDDDSMDDADAWKDINGITGTPENSPSIGDGRYVQWQAEISSEPFWRTDLGVLDYAGYITDQLSGDDWEFPEDTVGDYYLAGVNSTWIDDVEVCWDGEERTVAIKGDIAKMNTYGWAEVTVNGDPLLKALRINISMLKEVYGRTLREGNVIEVEPTRKRVVRSRSLH